MLLPRVHNKRDIEAIRKRRLFTEGSPRFPINPGDITAGSSALVGFESNRQHRKYLPFNYLRIVNDSGYDLEVSVSQVNEEILKNNSIFTNEGNFFSFLIKNVGSGTASGSDIHIHVQRKPTGA